MPLGVSQIEGIIRNYVESEFSNVKKVRHVKTVQGDDIARVGIHVKRSFLLQDVRLLLKIDAQSGKIIEVEQTGSLREKLDLIEAKQEGIPYEARQTDSPSVSETVSKGVDVFKKTIDVSKYHRTPKCPRCGSQIVGPTGDNEFNCHDCGNVFTTDSVHQLNID